MEIDQALGGFKEIKDQAKDAVSGLLGIENVEFDKVEEFLEVALKDATKFTLKGFQEAILTDTAEANGTFHEEPEKGIKTLFEQIKQDEAMGALKSVDEYTAQAVDLSDSAQRIEQINKEGYLKGQFFPAIRNIEGLMDTIDDFLDLGETFNKKGKWYQYALAAKAFLLGKSVEELEAGTNEEQTNNEQNPPETQEPEKQSKNPPEPEDPKKEEKASPNPAEAEKERAKHLKAQLNQSNDLGHFIELSNDKKTKAVANNKDIVLASLNEHLDVRGEIINVQGSIKEVNGSKITLALPGNERVIVFKVYEKEGQLMLQTLDGDLEMDPVELIDSSFETIEEKMKKVDGVDPNPS